MILFFLTIIFCLLCALVFLIWQRRERRSPERFSELEREVDVLRKSLKEYQQDAVAREKAEAANEAKTRFLATVSHEVRTPLNGILGMAGLLSHTPLREEQRAYLEAIETSGQALASLIDEILDFSKIEAGRIDLSETPFDLTMMVEGVVELLSPRAQGKGIEVAAYVARHDSSLIMGDEARLRQVLINIAGNAIKFTQKGGVGIRVTAPQKDWLRFEVEDTGIGIPQARQHTIFEEFEQVDPSATHFLGGVGLGLAISKRIVERMGGHLDLERSSPQGSLFTFTIPVQYVTQISAEIEAQPLPDLSQKRVLIVGASIFQIPFLSQMLTLLQAHVNIIEDVEQAQTYIEDRAPDIIIIDCALGEAQTQALIEHAQAKNVPCKIVLFSPFERHAAQGFLKNYDAWLVKPVRQRSFFERFMVPSLFPQQDKLAPLPVEHFAQDFHVLVVEDNDINGLLIMTHLKRLGAFATLVKEGEAALHQFQAQREAGTPFDVILMDIRMVGLSGLDVTRRIRDIEKEKNLPPVYIVALTANAFKEDREASFAAGVDAFLTKPLEFARLAQVFQERRN